MASLIDLTGLDRFREKLLGAVKTWLGDGTVSKLGTSTLGSASAPVYWSAGAPAACGSTLEASVTGKAEATQSELDDLASAFTEFAEENGIE